MSDNIFHLHLDGCQQCRDNPMDLCDSGAQLLHVAATGTLPDHVPVLPTPLGLACGSEAEASKIRDVIKDIPLLKPFLQFT